MEVSFDPQNLNIDWGEATKAALLALAALAAVYVLYRVILRLLGRMDEFAPNTPLAELALRLRAPLFWLCAALVIGLIARNNEMIASLWNRAAPFLVPLLAGWLALGLVRGSIAAMIARLNQSEDPVAARGRKTRLTILGHIASSLIVVVTIALILLNIPGVREVGMAMIASAGLAALVIGAAAQPMFRSLFSGIQVALTEPMRIGDMVVVDGQSGRIEEIRLSYVLLRCWDERLVVIPTSRFLDETFENWSRRNEALTGAVMLHLDPMAQIAPIREEFTRWLAANPQWDQRKGELLVVEAHAQSIELRLTMSAPTIGDLWDLRCACREHMLGWLAEHQPDALIRHRLEPGDLN